VADCCGHDFWSPSRLSGRGGSPEEQPSFKVVGQIGHANFHPGAVEPNCADEQLHSIFLRGEDMLDMRADFRFGGVGAPDSIGLPLGFLR